MRNYVCALLLAALSMGLVACNDVEIVDGKIPAQYLEQARVLVGSYKGLMEARSVTLNVALNGDRMVLTADPDIVGDACDSKIGDLKTVSIEQNGNAYEVTGAKFAFDPNNCVSIHGERLNLSVYERNGKIRIDARILDHTEWHQECHVECAPPLPNGGGGGCHQTCTPQSTTVYLEGGFTKVD